MFYLYNITYNIEEQIHDQWLRWVQEYHIPDVLKNTPFVGAKLIKVWMDEELGGITYSIQYQAENRAMLDIFLYESKFNIFGDMLKMFPNQFVSFSTELEVINEYSKL